MTADEVHLVGCRERAVVGERPRTVGKLGVRAAGKRERAVIDETAREAVADGHGSGIGSGRGDRDVVGRHRAGVFQRIGVDAGLLNGAVSGHGDGRRARAERSFTLDAAADDFNRHVVEQAVVGDKLTGSIDRQRRTRSGLIAVHLKASGRDAERRDVKRPALMRETAALKIDLIRLECSVELIEGAARDRDRRRALQRPAVGDGCTVGNGQSVCTRYGERTAVAQIAGHGGIRAAGDVEDARIADAAPGLFKTASLNLTAVREIAVAAYGKSRPGGRCTGLVGENAADASCLGSRLSIVRQRCAVGKRERRRIERDVGVVARSRSVFKRAARNRQRADLGRAEILHRHVEGGRSCHGEGVVVGEFACGRSVRHHVARHGKRAPVKQVRSGLRHVGSHRQRRIPVFEQRPGSTVFGTVAAHRQQAGGSNGSGLELTVAHAQCAVAVGYGHVKELALGRFGIPVRAQRDHAAALQRETAVKERVVFRIRHRSRLAHEDEVVAVGNGHAAGGVHDLLEADAGAENVRFARARIRTTDVELRVGRIGLRGVGKRFAREDRIGAAVGFCAAGRTRLHVVGEIHREVLGGLAVERDLQTADDARAFMTGNVGVVGIEFRQDIGNDACRVDGIVKGHRAPAEVDARGNRLLHVANAGRHLNALDVDEITGAGGIQINGRVIDVGKDLIQRGRKRAAQKVHGLFGFGKRDRIDVQSRASVDVEDVGTVDRTEGNRRLVLDHVITDNAQVVGVARTRVLMAHYTFGNIDLAVGKPAVTSCKARRRAALRVGDLARRAEGVRSNRARVGERNLARGFERADIDRAGVREGIDADSAVSELHGPVAADDACVFEMTGERRRPAVEQLAACGDGESLSVDKFRGFSAQEVSRVGDLAG